MQKSMARITLAALVTLPVFALAADAESIMQTMRDKQNNRMAGVQNYTIDQSTMGTRALLYFERVANAPAGQALFRMVPLEEINRMQAEEQGLTPMTPDEMRLYANGIEGLGNMMAQSGEGAANAAAGFAIGGDASDMTSAMAGYVREGADAMEESIARGGGAQDALEHARDMDDFARMAHLVGTESVNDRDAFLLRADDLNIIQSDGDQEFTINTASLWIDTADYVVLKMKFDGIAEADGESRAMTIEKTDSDFRTVAGSGMYQPFKQKFRIAGIMTPEEEAEMKVAAEQLLEFDAQVAAMPPSQQAMMEKMMGPKIETLRSILSGDGIVATTEIHNILVNTDGPPSGIEYGKAMFSVPE
jgi:hypothetical protein